MIVHQSLIDVDGRALDKAHQVSGHCPSDRDIVNSRLFQPIQAFLPPRGCFFVREKDIRFCTHCQVLPTIASLPPTPLFVFTEGCPQGQESRFLIHLKSSVHAVKASPT